MNDWIVFVGFFGSAAIIAGAIQEATKKITGRIGVQTGVLDEIRSELKDLNARERAR